MVSSKLPNTRHSRHISYYFKLLRCLGSRCPLKPTHLSFALTAIAILFLVYTRGSFIQHFVFLSETDEDIAIRSVLQTLKEEMIDSDISYIFHGDLSNNRTWEFDFSQISKRRLGRTFIEQTSYDANGRDGDFFNPIRFAEGGIVIFEDYGAGIFERLLWAHATDYKKNMDFVTFEVDGNHLFTVPLVPTTNTTYPFLLPFIRPNNGDHQRGFFIFSPVSYTKSLRIIMKWEGSAELNETFERYKSMKCHEKFKACKQIEYYAVIAYKLVYGSKPRSDFNRFILKESTESKSEQMETTRKVVSKMVYSPEKYAPGVRSGCNLSCQAVEAGREVVIYTAYNTAKVIQSMFFRLYDLKKKKVSKIWKRMLITMTWDGKDPQVKEIPLAGIFTTGMDSIGEVNSLTAGMRNTTCGTHGDSASSMSATDWTAYLFYEMPFWKSAKIVVRIPDGLESAIICTQVTTKELVLDKYHPRLTGYFSAQLLQQEFDSEHHKPILHLKNQWGHVVAINFFLSNEKVVGPQELDFIIETDQANVPVFSGTGLEDFFHYVHQFKGHINTSTIFNGIPFFKEKWPFRIYRCYRHMVFDPILFTTGILIYLESNLYRYNKPTFRNFLSPNSTFTQTNSRNSLLTVALYYGGKGSGGIITDKVEYAKINRTQFIPPIVKIFVIRSMFENQDGIYFNKTVLSMKPEQQVTHTFEISKNNVGVILRREYRSVVLNQKAEVKVDHEDAGIWFCPQGAVTEDFSLRLNDYQLPPSKTAGKDWIDVTIKAITRWETVSLQVLSVVLTN